MKLPTSRSKKATMVSQAALSLLQAEQMKGPGGTSPTQRAYRSHTSDLITRLDRLLAPKKSQTSADANGNKKADAQGAGKVAGPAKSRARNVVLRDLVDILTKIWRDDTSLELLEKKRDEMVPSPPPVEDGVPLSEPVIKAEESLDAPQKVAPKIAIKTEAQTIRSSLNFTEEPTFESAQMSTELAIGSFNTGEPFMECWTAVEPLPTGPVLANRSDDTVVVSWLEEQPAGVKREESCCTSPESEDDFDHQGFMMDVPQTPPESPFEEPVVPSKGGDFGFGWSAFSDDAPLMAW